MDVRKGKAAAELPAKPPDNHEEPEHNDEEYDVPQPFATVTLGHIVHSSEGARENIASFCEGVVLYRRESKRLMHHSGVAGRGRTIWASCAVDSRTSFPIPTVS